MMLTAVFRGGSEARLSMESLTWEREEEPCEKKFQKCLRSHIQQADQRSDSHRNDEKKEIL